MSNSKDYREELRKFIEDGRNDESRHLCHATYVVKTEDMFGNDIYGLQYHKTVIFGIREDGSYFFNNGGYFTATTKRRINDALAKCHFPYYIVQKSFAWFILDRKIEHGYMMFDVNNDMQDCLNLDCWGKPIHALVHKSEKIINKTRKF
jgi:hypothetical protein